MNVSCPYCTITWPRHLACIQSENFSLDVKIERGLLKTTAFSNFDSSGEHKVSMQQDVRPIHYCPVCGRKVR